MPALKYSGPSGIYIVGLQHLKEEGIESTDCHKVFFVNNYLVKKDLLKIDYFQNNIIYLF
jgi:hypothetical protein